MVKTINRAYLMHKDHVIMDLDINETGGIKVKRINSVEEHHIPVGAQMNEIKLHDWWKDRATPQTRQGADSALQKLGYNSTSNMLIDNLALSLTDCYWIKPYSTDIQWKDVSLFSNSFNDYFGEYTFNPSNRSDLKNKTGFFPASSQGEVQKKWCIGSDDTRFLIKGNYGDQFQQSINEVFATRIHEALDFKNHTTYKLTKIRLEDNRDGIGCLCNCFCNENTELISAWEALQTVKYRRNESLFYPLKDACLALGMSEEEYTTFISYEIMTDFLISNYDRHMNNIGILRDPDTLKIKGMAPIYDSGNSMFFRNSIQELKKPLKDIKTHSFIESERGLLRYVDDRNIIDLTKLSDIDFGIYKNDTPERQSRINLLKSRFEQKLYLLRDFQNGKDIWKYEKM